MKLLLRRPTTTVRADELRLGDRLAGGGELGVRPGGETVTHLDTGHEGDTEVVYVTTGQHPNWCWPLTPGTTVTVYDQGRTALMPRKPTRRRIRRHAARHRNGGTVYQSDEEFLAALDAMIADAPTAARIDAGPADPGCTSSSFDSGTTTGGSDDGSAACD